MMKETARHILKVRFRKRLFFCLIIFLAVLFSRCAFNLPRETVRQPVKVEEENRSEYLPGLDSTVVKTACLKAKSLFVSIENETLAEEKANQGRAVYHIYQTLNTLRFLEDSLVSDKNVLEQIDALKLSSAVKERLILILKTEGVQGVRELIQKENRERLHRIKTLFKDACALNPFPVALMVDLAHVYVLLGNLTDNQTETSNYFNKSIDLLEKATLADRSNHLIAHRLAESYGLLDNWQKVNQNYRRALNLLTDFAFLPDDLNKQSPSSPDSMIVYRYLVDIGISYMRLYQPDSALHIFDRAQNLLAFRLEGIDLEEYRNIIGWAEGDIRARELFVEAEEFRNQKKYFTAAEKYHAVLERTEDHAELAYLEAAYHLSVMEYEYLSDQKKYLKKYKPEQIGMNRLLALTKRIPKDSTGVPVNPFHQLYFDTFGTMLFNEGITAINRHDDFSAWHYFQQGAFLNAHTRARCLLELTKLTQHYGSIGWNWALMAYGLIDRLSDTERIELYKLLRTIAKRIDHTVLCRYFHETYRSFVTNTELTLDDEAKALTFALLQDAYRHLNEYLLERYRNKHFVNQENIWQNRYLEVVAHFSKEQKNSMRRRVDEVLSSVRY